ncbi:MAG: FkbM family methyltransferase [Thermofilum sp.]
MTKRPELSCVLPSAWRFETLPRDILLQLVKLAALPLQPFAQSSVLLLPPYRFLVPSSELEDALLNLDHVFFSRDYERLSGFEPRGVVVDLGAYAGFFSVRAAKRSRQVVSVEANPLMCHYLRVNAKLNGVKNARIICAAVDLERGSRELFVAENMVNSSLIGEYVGEFSSLKRTLRVQAITLNDVLRLAGVEKVDLLKVDVEGLEGRLVDENSEILHPEVVQRVVVEVHPPFCSAKSIAEKLSRRYRVAIVAESELPNQVFVYAWTPSE